MKKEVIEQDRKEIFEFWETQGKKFEVEKADLVSFYGVRGLEEEEDVFTFNIGDYNDSFTFEFGNADPDPDNPNSDEAVEFATDYIDLLDTIYSDVCKFIVSLGYIECDVDEYCTSWEKEEWRISVPNYPESADSIDIEEVKK